MEDQEFALHAQVEDRHWWFVARRNIIRDLLQSKVPVQSDRKVVEVGCGTGGNLKILDDDYLCIGIDVSKSAIDHARQRIPSMKFLLGDALEEHAEAVSQADAVLLMDVLEHIEEDRLFMVRLIDLMKPGSRLFLTVPACPQLWSPHDVRLGHYRRYMKESLSEVWTGLPVEEELLSYFNVRLYPIVRAIRAINQWRKRPFGETGTDLQMPNRFANSMLEQTFYGESERLQKLFSGNSTREYRVGVSLVAVLRRVEDLS